MIFSFKVTKSPADISRLSIFLEVNVVIRLIGEMGEPFACKAAIVPPIDKLIVFLYTEWTVPLVSPESSSFK